MMGMWDPSSATMTAAGVASLFLAQDQIDKSVNLVPKKDKVLEGGIEWLTKNFENIRPSLGTDLYLAYGIERVALAGGIKTFGKHDWYREGAALLLDGQMPDGSWKYNMASEVAGTSYALLFLSRGMAPVAMGKLQYEGPWNARGRDCARYVHWLSKQTEKALNWQVLSIDLDPGEWKHVPVLVISGHVDPKFTPDQMAKLRHYVEGGGLIFSSANEGKPEFSKLIRQKYAPALFGNAYEMRELPEDHAVFSLNYPVAKTKRSRAYGMSNGVREVWVHCDDDVSAAWQAYRTANAAMFEVPGNVHAYALGRTPAAVKFEARDLGEAPAERMAIDVARVEYGGNWDPEPGAWSRFAGELRYSHGAVVRAVGVKVAELDPAKTPVAHITGTGTVTFTAEEKAGMRGFIEKGGAILADAAGGNEGFATSFKMALAEMFPEVGLTDVAEKSPIVTGELKEGVAVKLERRRFSEIPETRGRPVSLMELKIGGRVAVVFSHGDLVAGLAGVRTWGVHGYTAEGARGVVWNALLVLGGEHVAWK
jgi:hypothetical protein